MPYFWFTGLMSAFLDNAPTYLLFFELAGGDAAAADGRSLSGTLAAISMGAVYMGALTYIGNAPNFMVAAIADEPGIRMPSFFGYLLLGGRGPDPAVSAAHVPSGRAGSQPALNRVSSPSGDRCMSAHGPMPRSAWIFPALAILLFAAATALGLTSRPPSGAGCSPPCCSSILFGTVFAAVHHAEVIAERIGEPFGTLLLTLAVTIIEVALIATIMLGDKPVPALARDTVFAVVMIVCNGLVGICIFIGGLRYREQDFQVSGANLYLSVLFVLATMTLVLPNYTLTTPGPFYSAAQLGFVTSLRCCSTACSFIPRPSGIATISSSNPPAPRLKPRSCRTGCWR